MHGKIIEGEIKASPEIDELVRQFSEIKAKVKKLKTKPNLKVEREKRHCQYGSGNGCLHILN
ncbi:MAG: hypothetical protein H0Z28_09015 [Archaeoglobus sp.]|nr:hypothetical protein [Archaeoglobus sp.]